MTNYEQMAEKMYSAYCQQAGGLTFDGKPLPLFSELGLERQSCWKAVAEAMAPAKWLRVAPSNLKQLADSFPELNPSNYGAEDVDKLHNWALEVVQAITALDHAAAPVVLPEPVAAQSRFIASPLDFWSPCSVEYARAFVGGAYEVRYLYTEQQVRELLATPNNLPAQAITEKAAKYDHLLPLPLQMTCGGYGLLDRRSNDDPLGSEPCPDCNAAPQPQADALDAERYRWLRDDWINNEPEAINMERAKGQRGLDAAIDAAIAAAKENK